MTFAPNVSSFSQQQCPQNIDQLLAFLRHNKVQSGFTALRQFAFENHALLIRVLPFLWSEAQCELPIFSSLRKARRVVLTQRQCLRVLANAFFCNFQRNSYRWGDYPSINLDRLFEGNTDILVAKLHMFFVYFECCQQRVAAGDGLQNKLTFVLQSNRHDETSWLNCEHLLQPLRVHELKQSIDNAKDVWRVDFANRYLGGASLSHGCVQEEIMFTICPELNVGRLFSPYMHAHEAIAIIGSEQFSRHEGYGWSFSFSDRHTDTTAVIDGVRQTYIVAMDAVDYRRQPPSLQYSSPHIFRDLNKSYAAFSVAEGPSTIATGNWGCGVFQGNAELKMLLQWSSASRANRSIDYYPFDNRTISKYYQPLITMALTSKLRVCDLLQFVMKIQPQESILAQFTAYLKK